MLTRVTPDRAVAPDLLVKELEKVEKRKIVVGDGALLCYNMLLENRIACSLAPPHLLMQNAVGVGFAAEALAREGKLQSAQELTPVYLRISQAERERNERMKKERQL